MKAVSGVVSAPRMDAQASALVREVLRQPGERLDRCARAEMESRFHHDLSRIRIHANPLATDSARTIGARAYSAGEHLVFDHHEYARDTTGDRSLLTHEVAHALQQVPGSWESSPDVRFGNDLDPAESEAANVALSSSRRPPRLTIRQEAGVVRRQKRSTEPADPATEQIRKGLFKEVLFELNGLSMKRMLARLTRLDPTSLEALMLHLQEAKSLGDRSVQRLAAAIGAAHMSKTSVTEEKLDSLDDSMSKAELPDDQRRAIHAILPRIRGGAATRIHGYFAYSSPGAPLEKYAAAKAFALLNGLNDAEMRETLGRVDRSILLALMQNSRMAEKLDVERLRQALYVAWVTRFPTEPARFDVGEELNPILRMTTGAKLAEGIRRSLPNLLPEVGVRLRELLSPESIAIMAAFTTAYIVSQTTPIGWVADVLVGGMIVASILMVGPEVVAIVKELMKFVEKANGATKDSDFDEAGQHFATAITKAGIDIVVAILLHRAGKAAKPHLKPSAPRSPGLFEVLKPNGERVPTVRGEPQDFATAVTPDGQAIRIPLESVPENVMMSEAKGGGGKAILDPKDPAYKEHWLSEKSTPSKQTKAVSKMVAESKPWSSLDVYKALTDRVAAIRRRTGIRRVDPPHWLDPSKPPTEGGTIAVAKTDVVPLRGTFYEGLSPEALPESLKGTPGTTASTLRPTGPLAENHAEAVALENLMRDLSKLSTSDLVGKRVWLLIEQEPCSSCASGIGTEAVPGPLKQFSMAFKQLVLEVHNQRTNTTYLLQDGKRL